MKGGVLYDGDGRNWPEVAGGLSFHGGGLPPGRAVTGGPQRERGALYDGDGRNWPEVVWGLSFQCKLPDPGVILAPVAEITSTGDVHFKNHPWAG